MNKILFNPGKVVATPGALELDIDLNEFLLRHLSGDWGDMCDTDKEENDLSLRRGSRLFSSYNIEDEKLWIITEADRSVTTFLLPEEY
jgi:hypothetical protein